MDNLPQILLLLAVAVAVIACFQRLHIPTSLGYLLVGLLLGPYTVGPNVSIPEFAVLGEFGVVFLLFTIGLNFSLPQLQALRGRIFVLGTAQVALTTLVVTLIAWSIGLPVAAAFVVGAVFAQSSSTIIGSQLSEQGEDNSPHGRLGLAMSVFQDVTAVPFLVIIPVLAVGTSLEIIAPALVWAVAKAIIAFGLVFFAERWMLRPLFHFISRRRSTEVFTLTVLLAVLLSSGGTYSLGLSLAFGAFLAGMMLGDTEFRHQVESSIRPFRDVLLGLFFVGVGMRIDPPIIADIWFWALAGALLILLSKTLLVTFLVLKSGFDRSTAWRTGLLLAVGGEFGFALIALALDNSVIGTQLGQITLASVLLSMVVGAFLIQFNARLAMLLSGGKPSVSAEAVKGTDNTELEADTPTVVIGGYGRVGHAIAVLLKEKGVPCVAFDVDAERVARGRADGYRVLYGDIGDIDLLSAFHAERAALVVLTLSDPESALHAVETFKKYCPQVPLICRAQDLQTSSELLGAGALHAHPEALEASLRLGAIALQMLSVPDEQIERVLQDVRDWDYKPLVEEPKDKVGK
ncbi:MAG: cation:proton antiporter [Pseudohongiellaceae bacterium]